jgi:hypothetical protein
MSIDGDSLDEVERLRCSEEYSGYGEYRERLCSRYVGELDTALDGGKLAIDGEWVDGFLHVVGG